MPTAGAAVNACAALTLALWLALPGDECIWAWFQSSGTQYERTLAYRDGTPIYFVTDKR